MLRAITLIVLSVFLQATPDIRADEGKTYIQAGRLVDVIDGRVRNDQVIVIAGDGIIAVGPAADIVIPAGAAVIDLSQQTVLPGLIDMHDHLTGDHRFHGYSSLEISIPRETLYGVLNARKNAECRVYNSAQRRRRRIQ